MEAGLKALSQNPEVMEDIRALDTGTPESDLDLDLARLEDILNVEGIEEIRAKLKDPVVRKALSLDPDPSLGSSWWRASTKSSWWRTATSSWWRPASTEGSWWGAATSYWWGATTPWYWWDHTATTEQPEPWKSNSWGEYSR